MTGVPRRPVIGVMGSGAPRPATLHTARALGRLLAGAGWIVLTGGLPAGVMEAAAAGARSVPGSLTVGVLPSGPDGPVSPEIDVALFTGVGEARNVINVLSSDVVVACGVEGPGTASEVALALRLARPTVLLAADPTALAFYRALAGPGALHAADTAEAAVELIERRLGVSRWRR